MSTGRVLAANPRSASQMSPGLAFIEGIEDFLHDGPRRQQVQCVGVGQLDHIGHDLLHLSRDLRPPGGEFLVQFLGKPSHAATVLSFCRSRKAGRASSKEASAKPVAREA